MLPTNSHTYPSHCAPCARHRSHVDSSWFRLVQRVRMTLGRSSQAHNIAASRCLMFSSMSTHAASCSFSLNGECNYHSCSSILRDQHRCAISAQIPIVNANKQIWVIVPRIPLGETYCMREFAGMCATSGHALGTGSLCHTEKRQAKVHLRPRSFRSVTPQWLPM